VELRDAESYANALLDAHKNRDNWDEASMVDKKKLQEELAEAKQKINMLTAKCVEQLDDQKLDELHAELTAALESVETWKAAVEIVALECPEFCCSISGMLMHDPVFTDNGRTFERKCIEKHFSFLKRDGKPIMTPQKQMLQSTTLVPNYALKEAICAMVQKKARELSLKKKCTGDGAAAGASKRARKCVDE
jgi:hypothetical protein